MAMSVHERYHIQEMAFHLKALTTHLDQLNDLQLDKPKGMSQIYQMLTRRFRRTVDLTESELEYGIVAHLDGRMPGPTEENDEANALGRSSQPENSSSQIENRRGDTPGHERA